MSTISGCLLHGGVLIETSFGPLYVALYGHDCPNAVQNFLKLCAMKFYHGATVARVLRGSFFEMRAHEELLGCDVSAESLLSSSSSTSNNNNSNGIELELAHQLQGPLVSPPPSTRRAARPLQISKRGLVVMITSASSSSRCCSSSFLITTSDRRLDYLDKKHVVIGEVLLAQSPSSDATLRKINGLTLQNNEQLDGKPIRCVRIKHTHLVDDPFSSTTTAVTINNFNIEQLLSQKARDSNLWCPLVANGRSSSPLVNTNTKGSTVAVLFSDDDSDLDDDDKNNSSNNNAQIVAAKKQLEELEKKIRKRRDEETQQIMLQLMGERPGAADSGMQPPDNVLFVCRLNPMTQEDDLAQCFESFGRILSCEIIKDKKSGLSLQYGFITFETAEMCSAAFRKMDRVKIDDSRIHVDFSQSLGGAYWKAQREKQQQQQWRRRPDRGDGGQSAGGDAPPML